MKEWSFADIRRVLDTVTPPVEEGPKGRRRRQILDAATALFIQHGYRKTSIDDVARAAGIAKGTLYLYFPSKVDLMIQVLADEKRQILDRFRPLVDDDIPGPERLKAWLRELLLSVQAMPLTARLLSGEREMILVLDEIDSDLRTQIVDLNVDFLTALIVEALGGTRAIPRESLRNRAKVLIAVFHSAGFFGDDRLRFGLELPELAQLLSEIMVDGLLPTLHAGTLRMEVAAELQTAAGPGGDR